MGATQIDQGAAKKLNALEKRLATAKAELDKAQGDYDRAFALAWAIFDQELGAGAPARFICEDGFLIGRQVPRATPTVEAAKLIALVEKHLPGLKGKRLLSRVLVMAPLVDQKKLAQEIVKGRISDRIVQQCVTAKPASPRRERHLASKQDQQSLAAGILESPTSDDGYLEVG